MAARRSSSSTLLADRRGATVVEYIALVVLLGLGAIGGSRLFGGSLDATLRNTGNCVSELGCDGSSNEAEPGTVPGAMGMQGPTGEQDPPRRLEMLSRDGRSPPPPMGDAAKLARARARLDLIPAGRAALEILDSNNVAIRVVPGNRIVYDNRTNEVLLGRAWNDETMTLSIAHEAVHAKENHDGTAPFKNMNVPRGVFVNAMIQSEIDASIAEVRAYTQLKDIGVLVKQEFGTLAMSLPAYDAGVAAEARRNPSATAAELQAAGEQRVRIRLQEAYRKGEIVTAVPTKGTETGTVNTVDYYGGWWDSYHAQRREPAAKKKAQDDAAAKKKAPQPPRKP